MLIKIIRFAAFTVFLVTLQNVIILQIHFGGAYNLIGSVTIPAASCVIIHVGYIFGFTGEWPYAWGKEGELTSCGSEAYISGSLRYSPTRSYNMFVLILYRNL